MTHLETGACLAPHHLETIDADTVTVPHPERLVHLQFRRFAGCPICHLHLRSIVRRHDEITAAGVTEVVVFHSDAQALREYQADLPFAVIADPERKLYAEFGVETSATSVAHPRAWLAAARGAAAQRNLSGALGRGEEHLGLPADFLIAPDGRIVARKYGVHADDQWSVDEIISLAGQFGSA
ncbi:peroxiredoxin-like family protein [Mycobacteroides abscessus]|uniref:peroxiredoxin-like family protein n=1 Tax=Mycobacteroides abscessus TaxID=36809 RepID=UPI0009A60498|nr:peroxiredoxin-like family protein [Mycobacteroides abscessus]SLJ75556.1 AhpC/TSA family [Mycobacteroides abscessus subsp. abscessus]SLJ77345.1 AhpC/TSA family [Mycobacteroides abscessus subsp. abscessus]